MEKRRKLFIAALVLCYTAVIAGASCFAGYKAAYHQMESSAETNYPQTFYATVSDIRDNHLQVKGMAVNDINFRGDFVFSITEETALTWRYTEIPIEDLDVGDNVAVTFTGGILLSDPGQLTQVVAVQLLDDEK